MIPRLAPTDNEVASSNLLEDLRGVTKENSVEVPLWTHRGEISPSCGLSICDTFVDFGDFILYLFGFGGKVVKGGNLLLLGAGPGIMIQSVNRDNLQQTLLPLLYL